MDEIRIDDLEVFAHHGVYPEETKNGQLFVVQAVLFSDLRKAGLGDDLELSTHYGEVCHFITKWMQEHTYQLIEAVAEETAKAILLHYPLICGVELEIQKPNAPIGLPFRSVSVRIHRQWHKVYLGIGSNMGNRHQYLQDGISALGEYAEIKVKKVSEIITTKPYGGVEQGDFLNGALEIETLFTPNELLEVIHSIETAADRERTTRWGPRTLDLDILFYDKLVYEDEELLIPHIDMQNRFFVLKPMMEIAPYFRHPILKKTMEELVTELEERNQL
ncbi:2-amino-4-hydroxy-6-hydroxymethyldihydropteridine diphosphokinase [Lachnospiraceae bacterium OttesenSCG-928-D06]|nr:2-amino-4-hydroxy-6-hydroxymethyldihydropteridine diphosphokinase [Lachnospiraceae bacterium OttesenSCG-928-D06]